MIKVDLAGLLMNAARAIRGGDRTATVTAFGREEAAKHIEQLRKGEATLAEFCELYCLPMPENVGDLENRLAQANEVISSRMNASGLEGVAVVPIEHYEALRARILMP